MTSPLLIMGAIFGWAFMVATVAVVAGWTLATFQIKREKKRNEDRTR